MSVVADAIRHSPGPHRLRARWVLPIDMPPIENGEIVIQGGGIIDVGKASGQPSHDFGFAALLPGLVNVHAHLEYTVLRGLLEDIAFFPWIRALNSLKAHLTLEDWVASATLGAAEMLAAGVTCLADASDSGAALPAMLSSGMRGTVYREVFGIEKEPSIETALSILRGKVVQMRAQSARVGGNDRVHIGISPHAPYTVRGELFTALAKWAASEGLPQTIHIAESPAEVELIEKGTGPFAEMYQRRRITWDAPGLSPVQYLDSVGALIPGTLAVHAVHTSPEDAALLFLRDVAVAHCPKSNGKLGAGIAPVRTLLDAGVRVGLGTDSMVSNNSVDLFEEMRFAVYNARAATHNPTALTAKEALHMATLGGAQALGRESEIGSLRAGKRADLCVVRLNGLNVFPASEDDPVAALVYGARASDVALTMVDGRVLYEGGMALMLDTARLRTSVGEARKKLVREVPKALGAADQYR